MLPVVMGDNRHMFLLSLALATPTQEAPNPYTLPIGRPGTVQVSPGDMVDTRTGAVVDAKAVAHAATGERFVYLGELHTNPDHHRMQADVIRALVDAGREVVVGFEMFTRPNQPNLAPWSRGYWTEEEFVEKADWKNQWGFDFALYRPIFEVIKEYRLPMVALNVPRDWVRSVGRGGLEALTPEQRAELPEVDLSYVEHRKVFNALMGGHPPTGTAGDNIYAAQSLWDAAMADSALSYLDRMPPNHKTVFVVIAGSGHVMYGQGINRRVYDRTGERGVTVTAVETATPMTVARGIGDYVFAAPPPPRA